jgi:hypothetical protein
MTQPQQAIYDQTLDLLDEIRSKAWLAEGMVDHGYSEESWTVAENLASTAHDLARVRVVTEANQLGATDAFNRLYDRTWPQFQWVMQTTVDVLQGYTGHLELLGLHQARLDGNGTSQITKPGKNDNAGQTLAWLDNFYEVAINDSNIAAILTENNVPSDKLARHAARVQELKEAHLHKEQAIAAKHQAVKDRDEAFETLRSWLRPAQRTARAVKKEHAAQKKTAVSVAL